MSRLALGDPDRIVPTPPVRPWLRPGQVADLVRDRLSYRSAPLGLVRTATRERLGAELVEGLPVGDDVPYVTRLWAETRVVVDRSGPAYLVGEDATDRVTLEPRPVATELAFVEHLVGSRWFLAYPDRVRAAVATKLLRIHVFGAVLHRPDPLWWTAQERTDLAGVVRSVLAVAHTAADPLSLADHDLLEACLDPSTPAERLGALARARRRHGRPRTLLPRHPSLVLHPEAPGPFMTASLAACGLRGRRGAAS
ncbi:glycosyl transferase [Ornithinimicrobium flavum]|uniref:glycosyl transferase n=1 Tax=Ornithinimicrobium flavum TaxID=1288636 RepID=UPI00106F7FFC|nr:glycosyl transferase [Ornithinimicrobium flavum]